LENSKILINLKQRNKLKVKSVLSCLNNLKANKKIALAKV